MNHSWLYPREEDHDAAAERLFSVDYELTILVMSGGGGDAGSVTAEQTLAVGRRRRRLTANRLALAYGVDTAAAAQSRTG